MQVSIVTKALTTTQRASITADPRRSLIISVPKDQALWQPLVGGKAKVFAYTAEAVFSAVMHQDLRRGFDSEENNRLDLQLERH